jgi:hypothetical protein
MLCIINTSIPQTTNSVQHNRIVNFYSKNSNITKKNPEALLGASKEVGLAVNAGETKYILICHHHSAWHNNSVDNRSLKNVGSF